MFFKLLQNSLENTITCNFVKKRLQPDAPTEVFASELCKTFKNSFFFTELLRWLFMQKFSYMLLSSECLKLPKFLYSLLSEKWKATNSVFLIHCIKCAIMQVFTDSYSPVYGQNPRLCLYTGE